MKWPAHPRSRGFAHWFTSRLQIPPIHTMNPFPSPKSHLTLILLAVGLVLPAAAEETPEWPDLKKPSPKVEEVVPGFLWIDAEDFEDYGGWTLDTQFVHLMGSGYLLAASVGTPVEDATTTVDIPRPGKYRIWVRAKNWLTAHSPGKFRLLVDGKPAEPVFGTEPTEKWCWRSAGDFCLSKGPLRLALHDLTGYYGRCDAILLTTDLDYVPPDKTDEIAKERARLTGRSLEPRQGGEFDVVVVGAGAAGTCAAIASARNGAKTAIIQNRPVLGGNASIELGVPICGAAGHQPNAREGGIIEEALRIKTRFGHRKMSEPFRILAEAEKNLTVFDNKHVFGVTMDGEKRIKTVRAIDTLDGDVTEYAGKIFIDGTGDGWVGFYAGADYHVGRESRNEHGEDLAPEKPDQITLSGCIMGRLALSLCAIKTDRPVSFTRPEWAPKIPDPVGYGRNIRNTTSGNWWLEHPGDIDDLYDAERARDELIRISYGYWGLHQEPLARAGSREGLQTRLRSLYGRQARIAPVVGGSYSHAKRCAGRNRLPQRHRPRRLAAGHPSPEGNLLRRGGCIRLQRQGAALHHPLPVRLFAEYREPDDGGPRHERHARRPGNGSRAGDAGGNRARDRNSRRHVRGKGHFPTRVGQAAHWRTTATAAQRRSVHSRGEE